MGSIFSAIGRGINAIISAIAAVIETIVSAVVTVRRLPSFLPSFLPRHSGLSLLTLYAYAPGDRNNLRRHPRHPLLPLLRLAPRRLEVVAPQGRRRRGCWDWRGDVLGWAPPSPSPWH
ncbi:hypothetical protein B0H11DRAFT_772009 [Mycena galericulata]|nr:hypothetical protein B0H11DRAFT_772009 [Mycena galericulata]